ncbi:MAG TPA: hypothetical protein VJ548_01430 [Azospira sp.]|nr:hypothetical protein [Azospira sp.]
MKPMTWTVPVDHPAFPGHFPGRPITPGVVLLDQALIFLGQVLGTPISACRLGAAKFLSPVAPGETLTFTFQPRGANGVQVDIHAGERLAASASVQVHTPSPLADSAPA